MTLSDFSRARVFCKARAFAKIEDFFVVSCVQRHAFHQALAYFFLTLMKYGFLLLLITRPLKSYETF